MIKIQDQDRVQEQTNDETEDTTDEDETVSEQNQNQIKKVVINRGEDDQLQVQTENQEQERENYETEDGEQVLFQLNLNNEGEDSELKIRKNDAGDTFIEQGDAKVKANFPMSIDAETGIVTITNPNGKEIELKETPSAVLAKVLDDKLIDDVEEVELVSGEGDQVRYEFKGTNTKKFLWLFRISAPITASVNAEDTSDIEIEKPWYLNWFGFLFGEA